MADTFETYPWTEDHTNRAEKLFMDEPINGITAIIVAMTDERAISYLEQDPSLVTDLRRKRNITFIDVQRDLYKETRTLIKNTSSFEEFRAAVPKAE